VATLVELRSPGAFLVARTTALAPAGRLSVRGLPSIVGVLGPALANAADEGVAAPPATEGAATAATNFYDVAAQTGIPTTGIPSPGTSAMADLWMQWGDNGPPVVPSAAEAALYAGDGVDNIPSVAIVAGLAAVLGIVFSSQSPADIDVEQIRKKGKPEWLLEEEAKREAEKSAFTNK